MFVFNKKKKKGKITIFSILWQFLFIMEVWFNWENKSRKLGSESNAHNRSVNSNKLGFTVIEIDDLRFAKY